MHSSQASRDERFIEFAAPQLFSGRRTPSAPGSRSFYVSALKPCLNAVKATAVDGDGLDGRQGLRYGGHRNIRDGCIVGDRNSMHNLVTFLAQPASCRWLHHNTPSTGAPATPTQAVRRRAVSADDSLLPVSGTNIAKVCADLYSHIRFMCTAALVWWQLELDNRFEHGNASSTKTHNACRLSIKDNTVFTLKTQVLARYYWPPEA